MSTTTAPTASQPAVTEQVSSSATADLYAYRRLTPIEIWKPPTDDLRGYFDTRVHDPEGVFPNNIIKQPHDWQVSFHVWLDGQIWKCVCGTLCFEMYLTSPVDNQTFTLSDLVGVDAIELYFEGCRFFDEEIGGVHLWHTVDVPAGQLPPAGEKGAAYRWSSVLSFRDPCGKVGVLSSHDQGIVQIFPHG
jgi:hypothetical protein